MSKKGKEIDLGGLRIQVDPIVLASRVVLRQKRLLMVVALIGGLLTAIAYLRTPKKYTARSNILIRYENFGEGYLQKLLNVAVGYLGSDLELMLIVNELDLYAKLRQSMPYEMALRKIRDDIRVQNQPRNIEIKFTSEDPVEAQRVVAFTTERLLSKMAELNEAPFNRELEAVTNAIEETAPKKADAERRLFEFKDKHPSIANRVSDLLGTSGSGLPELEAEIRRAEKDLIAARTGGITSPSARSIRNTPALQELRDLERQLQEAKARFTESHPEVKRLENEVRKQKTLVDAENRELDGLAVVGKSPEEVQRARVARAEARLRELMEQRVTMEKKAIKRPELQREWADLSMEVGQLQMSYSQDVGTRDKLLRDRMVAANQFQENFQLVDPARRPEVPSEPDRNKFMFIGMAITAIIGLLASVVREALRQNFVNATEFEEQTGLQVFAVLPDIKGEEASP